MVREHCRVGNNVILQNGVVVGSDGFGFAKDDAGHWYKIVQSGPTIVGDNVEIQANSCIDRASVGETLLAMGKNRQSGAGGTRIARGRRYFTLRPGWLAGSTEIGKNAILAGQVGVAGHCKVGDRVIITAQSGTHGDIPAGSMVSGSPAFDHKQWLRCTAVFPKLPEMVKDYGEIQTLKLGFVEKNSCLRLRNRAFFSSED